MGPDKRSGLLQKLEVRESMLCQYRNKLIEHSQASRELLDIFDMGWRPHHFDRLDFLWVSLDSLVQK
jgi:hypothetical protein